ncbi:MAG: hypothetical protein LBD10_05780 [Desulfobulbus sp.]|jgi:hypothetical protein|nr:hypothetical protein [Desulfobulbus sp.]MDR2549690.1 hypothetical protein [Desulfobulbus sp.]
MTAILDEYATIVDDAVIDHLRQLAAPLKGLRVVHVNSTREGGGVAEILKSALRKERPYAPATCSTTGIHWQSWDTRPKRWCSTIFWLRGICGNTSR